MIRDCLVFGIGDAKLQAHLLRENVDDLTPHKEPSYCRASEATASQLKEMRIAADDKPIHAVSDRRKKSSLGNCLTAV